MAADEAEQEDSRCNPFNCKMWDKGGLSAGGTFPLVDEDNYKDDDYYSMYSGDKACHFQWLFFVPSPSPSLPLLSSPIQPDL